MADGNSEIQKSEHLESKKSFLDEISIFHNNSRAAFGKMKNSRNKL